MSMNDEWIKPRDGETEQSALNRRVKMHEFLMTGGIQIGYNADKIMEYTAPIDDPVAYGPACPWHGEGCSAWTEIFAGNNDGTGTVGPQGLTLFELRERFPNIARADREQSKSDSADNAVDPYPDTPMVLDKKVDRYSNAADYAPNTVAFGDDNTFVASTALCARHWSRRGAEELAIKAGLTGEVLWGKAPKSRYGCVLCMDDGDHFDFGGGQKVPVSGNVWDRGRVAGSPSYPQYGGGFRRRPRLEDSRDTAVRAFDGIEEPDTIEIEGDEDE